MIYLVVYSEALLLLIVWVQQLSSADTPNTVKSFNLTTQSIATKFRKIRLNILYFVENNEKIGTRPPQKQKYLAKNYVFSDF